MGSARHIAIAGGGVIGLGCALALARRGLQVTVFEAGEAMREASWAAGGMLAADDPENPLALRPLSHYSISLYGTFLAEVERLSGQPVPLRTTETIQFMAESAMPPRGGVPAGASLLSQDEACALEPGLAAGAHRCLLLQEASLNPRDLATALPRAVQAAGVVLRERQRIEQIENDASGVMLRTAEQAIHADAVVNCCGAWADAIGADVGIMPRKGQMLVVAEPAGARLMRVLRSPEVYLIPRGDGRIVIGATVENVGYSKRVERSALEALRQRAAALWPPAADAQELDHWAGLRPWTADGLPVIGSAGSSPQRLVATGHYRNGILLAPATAELIASLIIEERPAIDIAPFSPARASLSEAVDRSGESNRESAALAQGVM